MRQRLLVYLILCCLFGPTVFAREAQQYWRVSFDHLTYDFGTLVSPAKDAHNCIFTFTNQSNEEVRIKSVKSTCRCYNVDWPREAIKPNGRGSISVHLDNNGLDGDFDKSVLVYFDNERKPVILHIVGHSHIASILDQKYQYRFGDIGVASPIQSAGIIKSGGSSRISFTIANLSSKQAHVSFQNISEGLHLSQTTFAIPAFSEKEIIATIRANNVLGTLHLYCTPFVNGIQYPAYCPFVKNETPGNHYLLSNPDTLAGVGQSKLCFETFVIPDNSTDGDQPVILVDSYEKAIGSICTKGKNASINFKVKNTGNGVLSFYKCEHPDALQVEYPSKIKSGKTADIICHISAANCPEGNFTAVATILTNSVEDPILSLSISGTITK